MFVFIFFTMICNILSIPYKLQFYYEPHFKFVNIDIAFDVIYLVETWSYDIPVERFV